MFTSKEYLHTTLGVDLEIATYFVDRKLPAENRYWKGRYLYVASGTGYLFIPLFFDLQFKIGIPKSQLLSPLYVSTCEAILHSAALYEFNEIDFEQHIKNCKLLVSPYIKDKSLFNDLAHFFISEELKPYKYLGTFSKALNRADSFLYALTTLSLSASTLEKVINQWYALIPSFLLMDDITDFAEDREKNEENSVNDFGQGSRGLELAIEYLRLKFIYLKSLNPLLGAYFENSLEKKLHSGYMQSILNS
jgi:hypothetical protein